LVKSTSHTYGILEFVVFWSQKPFWEGWSFLGDCQLRGEGHRTRKGRWELEKMQSLKKL
jgi:hypothetical protein